jgi:hypothetical protein
MISNRGRIGEGEARLPRTLHRAPWQKTHKHIPRITHSSTTKLNLRLDIPRHTSAIATHSHWHRLDLTLNPTRQKFKRYTDKRVRTPTVRQLRPKVQIHTTPLHNKSIHGTYSFKPINSKHLSTYGTDVRRKRTEQSEGAAPNLIHPHPTLVNETSLSSLTRQDEGHPTKPQPIKTSFIDARKGYNWERLTPQHFILVSLAPNNLKQKRS